MSTTKLVFSYVDLGGDTRSLSYNYANPSATTTQVKNLASGLVANGSVFENPPVLMKSAKFVTTTETDVDLE